jgi:hypothetical protein
MMYISFVERSECLLLHDPLRRFTRTKLPLSALIPCLRALSLVLRQSRSLQRWRAPIGLVLLRQKGGIWPLGRSAHCRALFRPAQ